MTSIIKTTAVGAATVLLVAGFVLFTGTQSAEATSYYYPNNSYYYGSGSYYPYYNYDYNVYGSGSGYNYNCTVNCHLYSDYSYTYPYSSYYGGSYGSYPYYNYYNTAGAYNYTYPYNNYYNNASYPVYDHFWYDWDNVNNEWCYLYGQCNPHGWQYEYPYNYYLY